MCPDYEPRSVPQQRSPRAWSVLKLRYCYRQETVVQMNSWEVDEFVSLVTAFYVDVCGLFPAS